ncbi:MAG: methyltransferase domain-containing protein [Verrucomicrobia bacterium]|nr:methyltransferase domain-containing protein [Verrucomicrobiota bacterium]
MRLPGNRRVGLIVPANTTKWNAADYAANSAVQQVWARELIAKVKLRGDEHILDVGCGDGKVTAEMAQAVPRGSVTGVDASRQMIAFAKRAFPATKHPSLCFQVMDARRLQSLVGRVTPCAPAYRGKANGAHGVTRPTSLSRQFDVVFSNAALHWVDDHQAILRGAAAVLKPGGRLIISCGGKGNAQDVFVALRPEMRLARWRKFFGKMPKPYFFHAPEDYKKWLPRFGFKSCRVELAPKDVTYNSTMGFAAWLRTTWLPYTQRVPEALREEFIAAIAARYVAKHPPDESGNIHVRMVRLEIDAVKI